VIPKKFCTPKTPWRGQITVMLPCIHAPIDHWSTHKESDEIDVLAVRLNNKTVLHFRKGCAH
jgi:hypothetical protein